MSRLFSLAAVSLGLFLAACGGGGGTFVIPPTPAGPFSVASLKGQYAFSMSGVDPRGAYIARVGSFVADGNGNITGGLEDVLSLGSGLPASVVSFSSGAYTVQPNGRAVMTLVSTNGALLLSMTLKSSSAGLMIQTDLNASSSGSFNLQTPADFSTAGINGKYVFDFSGISFSGSLAAPISIIGQLSANGGGQITGGTLDENDGNSATGPSGAMAIAANTYQLDATHGTTFGRASMTVNGRAYALYIVDHTHFKALEEDGLGGSSGDAVLQAGTLPAQNSAFTGGFVYLVGGASLQGNRGPIARVARFTANGSGGIGAVSYDENNDGQPFHISQGSNISKAAYAIDTVNAGSGRGTFTFTDSTAGTFSYVFYLSSPTQGVVQDISSGIVADGTFQAQTGGPFTTAGSAGNYLFGWSGVQLGSSTATPFEEDFVGQYVQASGTTNNIAGSVDFVELGISSNNNPFINRGISGLLAVNGDGTANNSYTIVIGGSPSTTIHFQAYFANPGTVLLVCSDSTRTTAGVATQQTQ
ncbi:MAG TPA: hypothetical protein VF758_01865 [Candidatus Acidoferrum sp.]